MSSARIFDALKIVIVRSHLPTKSLINLSSITYKLRAFTKEFITDSMLCLDILDDERLIAALVLPDLYARNPANFTFIAKIFTNIGFITDRINYDVEIVRQLVRAIKSSGYKNRAHSLSVMSNLAYFGNVEVLEMMIEEGFNLPEKLYEKVQNQLIDPHPLVKAAPLYSKSHLFLVEDKLRKILEGIISEIQSHPFKLNGGGDKSVPDIDHPIPKNAARVYKLIKKYLNSSQSLTENFSDLANSITNKLSVAPSKLSLWTGWGERDEDTTKLYTNIINSINGGMTIANTALHYSTPDKIGYNNNTNKKS